MEGAHPDYLEQLHQRRGAADRRRGSQALSAPPTLPDPGSPPGKGRSGFPLLRSAPHILGATAFWLSAPLMAIAGLIALEIQYRSQEREHEPY